jgi:hypothetical protein
MLKTRVAHGHCSRDLAAEPCAYANICETCSSFTPVGARYSAVGAELARCAAILSVVYRILYRFLATLASLAVRSGRSKDLEIIVLRHQLMVLRRQGDRPEPDNSDRSLLGAIAQALPAPTRRLARHPRHPAALAPATNRPPLDPTHPRTRTAIHNLRDPPTHHRHGHRQPDLGLPTISGELTGLGHNVGASTVWRILKRHGIDPAPHRSAVTSTPFLRSQAALACDFATIDTALLRRFYLLFLH